MAFIILIGLIFIFNGTGIGHRESSDHSIISKSAYLKGGEPFESVEGNRKAILFIHGFPGSPKMYYLVRELAIRDGYDVFVPALPGFATNHSDMLKGNFSMWYAFLVDYYENIRTDYDEFYIVGNSMGGALTLKLAENYSGHNKLEPTAVATVAAPVFIHNLPVYFIRTISLFKSYVPSKNPQKDISLDEDGECAWVGYRGHFPKQIFSLVRGLKGINKYLSKITVPCYLCHAKEDKTVPFKNLKYIVGKVSSDDILVRTLSLKQWSHSNHSMFIYKSVVGNLWSDIDSFFKRL